MEIPKNIDTLCLDLTGKIGEVARLYKLMAAEIQELNRRLTEKDVPQPEKKE